MPLQRDVQNNRQISWSRGRVRALTLSGKNGFSEGTPRFKFPIFVTVIKFLELECCNGFQGSVENVMTCLLAHLWRSGWCTY